MSTDHTPSQTSDLQIDHIQDALDSGTITIEFTKNNFIVMVCPDGSKKSFPVVPNMGLYQIASTCFVGQSTQSMASMSKSAEGPSEGYDTVDFDSE
jgi:hypothetical protein